MLFSTSPDASPTKNLNYLPWIHTKVSQIISFTIFLMYVATIQYLNYRGQDKKTCTLQFIFRGRVPCKILRNCCIFQVPYAFKPHHCVTVRKMAEHQFMAHWWLNTNCELPPQPWPHTPLRYTHCKSSQWRVESGWRWNKCNLLILMYSWTFFLLFLSDWFMVHHCFLIGQLVFSHWLFWRHCTSEGRCVGNKNGRKTGLLSFRSLGVWRRSVQSRVSVKVNL